MNTEETPQGENQPDSTSAGQEQAKQPSAMPAAPAAATKKPRSPIRRAIVWILILAIVGFCLVELRAKYGHEWSLRDFKQALKDNHEVVLGEGDTDQLSPEEKLDLPSPEEKLALLLSEEKMAESMWFFPEEDVEEDKKKKVKIVTMKWFSLLDKYEFKVGIDISNSESPTALLVDEKETERPERFIKSVEMRRNYFINVTKPGGNAPGMNQPRGGNSKKRKKRNKTGIETKSKSAPKEKPKTKD